MKQETSYTDLERPKPTGLRKWFIDFPVLLYRIGLGWVFGKSLIVLVHKGRKSGLVRRTVVEALGHRAIDGEFMVLSGHGRKADWFRNIEANPPLELWVGRQRSGVTYRVLDPKEAAAAVQLHIEKYPRMAKRITPELVEAMESGRLVEALQPLEVVAFRQKVLVERSVPIPSPSIQAS